jgi:multidrug resistance protein MdtO
MTAFVDSQQPRRPLWQVLAGELASREGRFGAVARIATGSAITVAIAMIFRVPQPTYMAYIVFLISKDERNATVTAALGGLAAATFAILLVLGLELIDTAEPALRLPFMAMATFAAMFTARTFTLGPISFLAGFVVVLLQSLVDDVPNPEALTRATLWTWVVIAVPVAVTIVVNLLFGPAAVAFMNRSARKVLEECEASLANGDFRKFLAGWRARILPLLETAQHNEEKRQQSHQLTVPAIRALLDFLVILEALPDDLPQAQREELAGLLRACRHAIESDTAALTPEFLAPLPEFAGANNVQSSAVIALRDRLSALFDALVRPGSRSENTGVQHLPRRVFVADAFSNPAHWQFALKTTMAVMISYGMYTLLDWPGMRTAIVTCFFVALSSLGETVHKLLLRLSGAVMGGLIAGLCIVFVVPHLTDIGQLCLLIAAVSVGAAWVATSSELLSYAGMQIAFAFFLGVLQGYAPATDLTALRDRIAGILLGNIAITIVFSSIWPQSVRSGVRGALAEALRAIGGALRRPCNAAEARMRVIQALARAYHLHALSLFEMQMLPSYERKNVRVSSVTNIERLAGTAFILTTDPISSFAEPRYTAPLANWAETAADSLSIGEPMPPGPGSIAFVPATASEPGPHFAQYAIEQFELEVQHAASTVH